jgi:adenylate cyclase
MKYARLAVQIDQNDPYALAVLAHRTAGIDRDYDGAVALAERAVGINPNWAYVMFHSGYACIHAGLAERAIAYCERALRLSPREPRVGWIYGGLALARIQMGRDEEALIAAREAVRYCPNGALPWRVLSSALALRGQLDSAHRAAQRLSAVDPECSLASLNARFGFAETARARFFEGMRLAGVPE